MQENGSIAGKPPDQKKITQITMDGSSIYNGKKEILQLGKRNLFVFLPGFE